MYNELTNTSSSISNLKHRCLGFDNISSALSSPSKSKRPDISFKVIPNESPVKTRESEPSRSRVSSVETEATVNLQLLKQIEHEEDKDDTTLLGKKRDAVEEKNFQTGRWTKEEHKRFVEAILKYGNEWREVQQYVKTRSSTQARSHAQKFFLKIKRGNFLKLINKGINIQTLHSISSKMNETEYNEMLKALYEVPFEKGAKMDDSEDLELNEDIMKVTPSQTVTEKIPSKLSSVSSLRKEKKEVKSKTPSQNQGQSQNQENEKTKKEENSSFLGLGEAKCEEKKKLKNCFNLSEDKSKKEEKLLHQSNMKAFFNSHPSLNPKNGVAPNLQNQMNVNIFNLHSHQFYPRYFNYNDLFLSNYITPSNFYGSNTHLSTKENTNHPQANTQAHIPHISSSSVHIPKEEKASRCDTLKRKIFRELSKYSSKNLFSLQEKTAKAEYNPFNRESDFESVFLNTFNEICEEKLENDDLCIQNMCSLPFSEENSSSNEKSICIPDDNMFIL